MPESRRSVLFQQLLEFERGRLVWLLEVGSSYHRIAEQIGKEVSVVSRWWHKWFKQHIYRTRRGTGVHRRTDERTDWRIRRATLSSRTSTASQILASAAPKELLYISDFIFEYLNNLQPFTGNRNARTITMLHAVCFYFTSKRSCIFPYIFYHFLFCTPPLCCINFIYIRCFYLGIRFSISGCEYFPSVFFFFFSYFPM